MRASIGTLPSSKVTSSMLSWRLYGILASSVIVDMPVMVGWPGDIAGQWQQLAQWLQLALLLMIGEWNAVSSPPMTYLSILPHNLSCCLGHMPLPPFKGHTICHPVLSLSDDDNTVYFMNKIVPRDDKAWVIAINRVTKELLGVAGLKMYPLPTHIVGSPNI